ncbi:MAG: nitroreductase [Acidimicrobiia bacterium]|nr:nitroreductase [Acidimicrobiia bacterium]MDH4362669.1 nitroreductase [Acidimicrobiia bacterium]MDH5291030.1 nitroreductase [Acidimicrobiia bacterium]
MDVSTAVDKRKSVRAFLDQPVDDQLIADLLEKAARAPSGGNVQPWRIYVVNGAAAERFKAFVAGRDLERPAYDIYPRDLGEPYRTSRWELGEQMYASIGIPRDDKPARLRHVARNYELFGAPAAVFCFVDRQMGPPQWSDLGMFLQTFMLLAEEAGLGTCAQESWAMRERAVSEFVGAPGELRIFCAIALGYEDTAHPINNFRSPRLPLADWATFIG